MMFTHIVRKNSNTALNPHSNAIDFSKPFYYIKYICSLKLHSETLKV